MSSNKIKRFFCRFMLICSVTSFVFGNPFNLPVAAESPDGKSGINNGAIAKLHKIIAYGALAPSTQNAQMWKVKFLSDHVLLVMLDRNHALPRVDPENRESLISIGAFIENMVEAASAFGFQVSVQVLAQNAAATDIARLDFTPSTNDSIDADRILGNIANRHTLRIPYYRKALLDTDYTSLLTANHNCRYFPLGSREGQYLRTAVIDATRQQVFNDQKQQELAALIRFSKKEALAQKDGLTPEMMGISGLAKWFVSIFYNQKTVLGRSFRNQTIAAARKQAENCAGFIVLTSPDSSAESLLNAGRDLERLLIQATGLKIAVQPMSAPLEESPWRESVGSRIGLNGTAQMILRVGYVSDYGKPVSLRRDVTIVEP